MGNTDVLCEVEHVTRGVAISRLLTTERRPSMPKYDAVVHEHVPVIEVAEPVLLDQLLTNPTLAFAVVKRLSPTVAVIDPAMVQQVTKQLAKYGHLPKVV